MDPITLIAGGLLIGQFIYHRWFEDPPPKPKPAKEIEIPRTDEGAPIPLIYGRCRVRSALLAWAGDPVAIPADDFGSLAGGADFIYAMNMFFVIGIPFPDGTNKVRFVYVDDLKLGGGDLSGLNGAGGVSFPGSAILGPSDSMIGAAGIIGQNMEFLDGRSTQMLRNPAFPFAATSVVGQHMEDFGYHPAFIPGHRGMMSVYFYNNSDPWWIGSEPRPGVYSFDVSSYPSSALDTPTIATDEANPIDVLRDVLTGMLGKLGEPASRIDLDSFEAAAVACRTDGLGYSRSFDSGETGEQVISEIEQFVDGIVWEEPANEGVGGIWKIKLIRPLPAEFASPIIDNTNCDAITNLAIGGWTGLVNKVRVTFKNREKDYDDDSVTAHNIASALGQDGVVREVTLNFPGCCTAAIATILARRELSARSRPIWRCRARVDRTLLSASYGDVVKVTWPEALIGGMMFRVATVIPGAIDSNHVELDLISDQYYVWRGDAFGEDGSFSSFVAEDPPDEV